MIQLSLKEIAEITGGSIYHADPDTIVSGSVEFDSRKISNGGIFLCLPGARVDGHDFAQTAINAGAVAVLAARDVGVPAIVVQPQGKSDSTGYALEFDDEHGSGAAVLKALSALAHAVATRLDMQIVGITGSAGKTSTKDLAATVLTKAGEVIAPPGSFNNEIGHPYTVLRCSTSTDFLVAEMSARRIGNIAELAAIAPPTVGAVLNVGSAHLGEFGSREGIAQAKGELVEALPPQGTAILNLDNDLVAPMKSRTHAKVLYFSAEQPADIYATDIHLDEQSRAHFALHIGEDSRMVNLQVHGEHQVPNALAAAAIGHAVGIPIAQIAAALSEHTAASAHRMDVQTRPDGVVIIDDAYNANPESMRAGLKALGAMARSRGTTAWAVLGEMGEMGDNAEAEHAAIAEVLRAQEIEQLIVVDVSPATRAMVEAARAQGITTQVAKDCVAAAKLVQPHPGDCVLAKASNAQKLWEVAEALRAVDCEKRKNPTP
ncbi:UDP-N-acetylmuramoyl-tripeptide--D-alanyl-D-alanine ligase [Corynebacterium spheniscorum]|uniref:UDP-N-acetylmuramoyl-tripeptide--D-alanyl-D-alanine ligase n=1 Tax=Corynebacterium spheniscorum TaxID=185761 RepID=A0A1I2RGR8_9CORY|nr:UDP-N-acetylmuramoyl-tripeptide--D-alanyl-D-alanine ligase [Corynebacterium spheniscorum]KAA8722445.1 UDP-N-acetylmuramoyl-tripeptide--D-alanyl-D-alanine ligase [Corynebacterium spheniscorum]SFG39253.1 UDP-N-acetylmuramoyl-tripeptide--D-alanyl-D-alanine ligase [Corynebacterium spheniscorum]